MSDPVDVVVIGDGPAGSALASACRAAGVDVVLVGTDDAWHATYGAWVDEVAEIGLLADTDVLASHHPNVVAWTDQRHDLGRSYGVLDNVALRAVLRAEVQHVTDRVARVETGPARHHVHVGGGMPIACRLVVDAAGWPSAFSDTPTGVRPPAWQTAFGAVLPEPPPGDLATPTFMDFRDPPGMPSAATFAYSLPVADGWLVEETVLAARPAVDPDSLVARLAARVGISEAALLDRAVRIERVRIPMGGDRPRHGRPIVAFGAAAGYVNPTSGYSVVRSLVAAPAVAAAIARSLAAAPVGHVVPVADVWDAVWPRAARRTRVLHDYGLDLLVRLDAAELRAFFDAFFSLPPDAWSAYVRADSAPGDVAAVMRRLFSASPWSIRRRLVAGNPLAFARLVRPA